MTNVSEKGPTSFVIWGTPQEKILSAALIGMGVLWLFTGNRTVAAGRDFVRDGLNRIPDEMGNALDVARSTVRSGGEAIAERVSAAKEAALDRASGSLDSTVRTGREYADAASEFANSVPGATVEMFDTVRSNLADIFQSQPLALGAIGLAIGAGIAAALPKTELERDYVGETSDALMKKAAGFAEEKVGRVTKVAENVMAAVSQEASEQGLTVEAAKSAAADLSTKISRVATAATSQALKPKGEHEQSAGQSGSRP